MTLPEPPRARHDRPAARTDVVGACRSIASSASCSSASAPCLVAPVLLGPPAPAPASSRRCQRAVASPARPPSPMPAADAPAGRRPPPTPRPTDHAGDTVPATPAPTEPPPTSAPPEELDGYRWPMTGGRITTWFQPVDGGFLVIDGERIHDGIDIATFCGDYVLVGARRHRALRRPVVRAVPRPRRPDRRRSTRSSRRRS